MWNRPLSAFDGRQLNELGLAVGVAGVLSFFEWDLLTDPEFVGVGNFVEISPDEHFLDALGHTLAFMIGYVCSEVSGEANARSYRSVVAACVDRLTAIGRPTNLRRYPK